MITDGLNMGDKSRPLGKTVFLQVAAFEARSLVNGPGSRAVLWVQGCGRRCLGCFNPEFLLRQGGRMVASDEVIGWIAEAMQTVTPVIEGVSFSGGEPFDQATGLAMVAHGARALGLGVIVFTGHPWEDLQGSHDVGHHALLESTDMLVAGPYERDQPGTHPMLSSSNQRLIFLTERYRSHDFGQRRRMEFRIGRDGTVRASGFPENQGSSTLQHFF